MTILTEEQIARANAVLRAVKQETADDAVTILAFVLRTISTVAENRMDDVLETSMKSFIAESEQRSWQLH